MDKWQIKKRPLCLERRFEFKSYAETREFLEQLGDLSEEKKIFPDISFGRTYVNLTIRPEDEANDSQITDVEKNFASEIDGLVN